MVKVKVCLSLDPELIRRVDAVRDLAPRSSFVERVLWLYVDSKA